VEDYAKLMKDFPIKQLLLASDMDSLRNAIINIFGHFRKIRNTTYPALRAQKLSQAISRDLRERMLSLLSERNLLDITYAVLGFLISLPESIRLDPFLPLFSWPLTIDASPSQRATPHPLTHALPGTPTFRA
jgi:hypothetical protein